MNERHGPELNHDHELREIREILSLLVEQTVLQSKTLLTISKQLAKLNKGVNKMGAAIELLRQEVADLTTVVDSAVALIQGFVDRIKDAATLEEVQVEVAKIEAEKQALADAVAANT